MASMFTLYKRGLAKATRQARNATTRATTDLVKTLLTPTPKPKSRVKAKPKPKTIVKPAPAKPGKTVTTTKPRAGLGETVARLKAPRPALMPDAPAPRGASFRAAVHANDTDQRSYKLYIPARATVADCPAMPLIVMLHGCSQTPEDFARGTRMNALAEEYGLIIAYPAQPGRANANRCWNWFRPGDQGRGIGEPALIAGIAREILETRRVDPARVYVAGLSAGGALAAVVAAAYPEIFAAVCVHSGLPVGAANNSASAVLAMSQGAPGLRPTAPMPTICFHGDADRVVHPRNGRYVEARALVPFPSLTKTVKTGTAPGGRRFVRSVYRIGSGKPLCEAWVIEDAGHAWAGGAAKGSYTDPAGPDASREMLRFFLRHRRARRR